MRFLATWLITSTALVAAPALAQEEGGDAPPRVSTLPATTQAARSYTPLDFTRFSPRTALDMLRQVPGFTIEEQDQERRGLGQATANRSEEQTSELQSLMRTSYAGFYLKKTNNNTRTVCVVNTRRQQK